MNSAIEKRLARVERPDWSDEHQQDFDDHARKDMRALIEENKRLRENGNWLVHLVDTLIENDPDEIAADGGVTVLMFWRKAAVSRLRKWRES
jgi:hypothetical protein